MKTCEYHHSIGNIFYEINSEIFQIVSKSCIELEDSLTFDIRTNRRSRTQCESVASRQLEWKSWTDETLGLTQARIENLSLTDSLLMLQL